VVFKIHQEEMNLLSNKRLAAFLLFSNIELFGTIRRPVFAIVA